MSRETELISRIKELEDELAKTKKQKRYGLVWEDKKEDVVERCKNELPVLVADETRSVSEDPNSQTHILIEGDNYHALSVLAYTHAGKVDVIYIDPPYNTGARDWKYNNDYVDSEDQFRHSKWLSMMDNRLRIAKNLLKEEGVLILAIDENECSHVGVLLEERFNDHEIHKITVVHNPRGIQGTNFSYTNEFLFFVFRKGYKAIGHRKIKEEDIDWRNLRDNGGESLRTDARNCFYGIHVKEGAIIGFGEVPDNTFHPESSNITEHEYIVVYPVDRSGIERKWRYARQSVEGIINSLRVKQGRNGLEIEIGKDFGTVRTVWQDSRYDANENGTKLIQKIVPGIDFSFPKSLWAVYDSIAPILSSRKNAVVLDFFAGSGTTGHAVLELNKEDGGNRQFILCTNNENKIAEEVTYPRIRNVIKGYSDVEGIPANLRYFRTDFISTDKSIDDLRHKFILRCTEMLQVRESCFDVSTLSGDEYFQVFENRDLMLAILYHPYEIKRLKEIITQTQKPIVAYIFSMGMEIFQEELAEYSEKIRIETVPDEILETYKKIFGF